MNRDLKDFLGKLGLKAPRRQGVEAMGRQLHVAVKDPRKAVLSLLRREEPAALVARRIDVSEAALYRWQDEFLNDRA